MNKLQFLDATGLAHYDGKIKVYIASKIAAVGHLKREVVESLPSVGDADPDTIYLVARGSAGQKDTDIYNEYLLINDKFELIGNTAVDFSDYYTKDEVDGKMSDAKNYTDGVKSTLEGKISEAEQNAKDYADSAASIAESNANGYTDEQIAAIDLCEGIKTTDIDALFEDE